MSFERPIRPQLHRPSLLSQRPATPLATRPALASSHQADGFTSDNVLRGAPPILSQRQWQEAGEPFPLEQDTGVFKPLDSLERLHAEQAVTHVVLSVGGNDVREILSARLRTLLRLLVSRVASRGGLCACLAGGRRSAPDLRLVFSYSYVPASPTLVAAPCRYPCAAWTAVPPVHPVAPILQPSRAPVVLLWRACFAA